MVEAWPEKLIGDGAYDNDLLDGELKEKGIDLVEQHKRNRVKPAAQNDCKLRRYKRYWLVERCFVWLQWQWGLFIRWEFHMQNFLGFVQPVSIKILLRKF